MKKRNKITKEQAEKICKEVSSIADFCRAVGWQPRGDNYKIFHKYVQEYNLDVSHFCGHRSNIGNCLNIGLKKEDFFKKNKLIKSQDIIKKLIRTGEKEYKCEICNLTEWNNKPLHLQVHHKDGDHFNNEISNLQLLCPNCHSQTDTFCGRKNKGKYLGKERVYAHMCKKCGKKISDKTKYGLCRECLNEEKKKKYSIESIIKRLKETHNFSLVGREFGVTDGCIRRRLKANGYSTKIEDL